MPTHSSAKRAASNFGGTSSTASSREMTCARAHRVPRTSRLLFDARTRHTFPADPTLDTSSLGDLHPRLHDPAHRHSPRRRDSDAARRRRAVVLPAAAGTGRPVRRGARARPGRARQSRASLRAGQAAVAAVRPLPLGPAARRSRTEPALARRHRERAVRPSPADLDQARQRGAGRRARPRRRARDGRSRPPWHRLVGGRCARARGPRHSQLRHRAAAAGHLRARPALATRRRLGRRPMASPGACRWWCSPCSRSRSSPS